MILVYWIMKNKNLNDYLFEIIKTISLDKEEEAEIIDYINSISEKSNILFSYIEKDDNKKAFIKFLEAFSKDSKNV